MLGILRSEYKPALASARGVAREDSGEDRRYARDLRPPEEGTFMKRLLVVIALAGFSFLGFAACDETSCSDDCDSQCAAIDCSCLTETNGECECEGCG
jgi:hypothetical protein